MKVTIIQFVQYHPFREEATHYYADGKRISYKNYLRYYSGGAMEDRGYIYDYTEHKTVTKNGIDRNYTIMHFNEKKTLENNR